LIKAYLQEKSQDMQRSLVFYLGWAATDHSREFLTGILERRIEGPRWSALRALSMSSITNRYETISQYLNDSDEQVRQEAKDGLRYKLEEEFENQIADTAESLLFPLGRKLVATHQGEVPLEELPQDLAGRRIRWGMIRDGALDIRFEDNQTGLLINPSGASTFPVISGYFVGGGRTKGISPYSVF
jgi:hypothetical protein